MLRYNKYYYVIYFTTEVTIYNTYAFRHGEDVFVDPLQKLYSLLYNYFLVQPEVHNQIYNFDIF